MDTRGIFPPFKSSLLSPGRTSGMNELAAGGMDGQDRAWRLPHHLFGDAAQQEMSRDAATVCAHDDQIDPAVRGKIDDLRMRRAVQEMRFDIEPFGVLF